MLVSPDESTVACFAPTLALPAGRVFQSPPYVSGDTGQWVISNSTPLAAARRAPAFVHFEVSVESFRQKAAAMVAGRFRVSQISRRVSDQAESTTASTQNIAASANELARTSEALNELLDRFRIRA